MLAVRCVCFVVVPCLMLVAVMCCCCLLCVASCLWFDVSCCSCVLCFGLKVSAVCCFWIVGRLFFVARC